MLKKRQAARGKGFSTGDDRVKTGTRKPATPRKALPAGKPTIRQRAKTAGRAVKTAADIGSAIVRQRRGGTSKEAVGAPKKSGPGTMPGREPPGRLVKSSGGKLAKIDRSKPDEKQAGKRPGTTRDVAAAQRERILKDKGMKNRGNLAGAAYKKARGLYNAGKKLGLKVPSTETKIGDSQSVSGPKKFGKSAS
jgi:hypothetical protein